MSPLQGVKQFFLREVLFKPARVAGQVGRAGIGETDKDNGNRKLVYDTIIIGAGAAGFFAALAAGQRKKKTLLLEKVNKTGAKILMSGGTRCNLTQNTDERGIVDAFGRKGKFLYPALSRLGPKAVVAWFEQHGVPTKIEPTGKIFPRSDRALDVRNALLTAVESLPTVELKTNSPVESIRRLEDRFLVNTANSRFESRTVVIASGGKSYPGCGTTGDGYAWARDLGHTIVDPIPALTPIVCPAAWVKELKGITMPDIRLGVFAADQTQRISEKNFERLALGSFRGSLLFTHFGLSGPAAMNVSKHLFTRPARELCLVVDFLPDLTVADLESRLTDAENRKRTARSLLQNFLPANLLQQLLMQVGIDSGQNLAETRKNDLKCLIDRLKRCELEIEGTRGFKKAEVTSGGVSLQEVNSQTMESRPCPGLFLAGEILDLDGPIGGFNFQSAFSTGYLAGRNV